MRLVCCLASIRYKTDWVDPIKNRCIYEINKGWYWMQLSITVSFQYRCPLSSPLWPSARPYYIYSRGERSAFSRPPTSVAAFAPLPRPEAVNIKSSWRGRFYFESYSAKFRDEVPFPLLEGVSVQPTSRCDGGVSGEIECWEYAWSTIGSSIFLWYRMMGRW